MAATVARTVDPVSRTAVAIGVPETIDDDQPVRLYVGDRRTFVLDTADTMSVTDQLITLAALGRHITKLAADALAEEQQQ